MWQTILKYLLEGLGIAFVTKYMIGKSASPKQLLLITLSITLTFLILDQFAPSVATGARQGVGLGTGLSIVQFGSGDENSVEGMESVEGMDDPVAIDYYSNVNRATPSEHGQPIMRLNKKANVMDQYYASESMQHSTPSQVDFIGRFMDDRKTLKDAQPASSIHEAFVSKIEHEPVQGIMGFSGFGNFASLPSDMVFEKFESVPGGAASTSTSMPASSTSSPATTQYQTAAEHGLVYGTVTEKSSQKHFSRSQNTVYSGDIINITDNTGASTLSGLEGDKYIVADTTTNPTGNKLFKLRFQLVKGHQTTSMVPLKYGSAVYLQYNDDSGKTHLVNHNAGLNMIDAKGDNAFEIVNPQKLDDTGIVTQGTEVLIRRSITGDKLQYLQINTGKKRIDTNADVSNATKFKIIPQKGCGPLWRFI